MKTVQLEILTRAQRIPSEVATIVAALQKENIVMQL